MLFVIIINCTFLCIHIYSSRLKTIDIQLKENELAVVFLSLKESKSLLLKNQEEYILYVLDYQGEQELYSTISLFSRNLQYVFMREEYPLIYPYKVLLDHIVVLKNLQLERNRFYFHDKTFCINETKNCDYIYLTKEIPIENPVNVIFYDENLSSDYIESLHQKWGDFYKITSRSYTILFVKEEYEVIHLER